MNKPFTYNAIVTDVYDGDTITVDVDLGFGVIFREQKIRLFGIDTPEMRGEEREEGIRVRDYVRKLILNENIIIETIKDKKGKYGRWLGVIYLASMEGESINNHLIDLEMAERCFY